MNLGDPREELQMLSYQYHDLQKVKEKKSKELQELLNELTKEQQRNDTIKKRISETDENELGEAIEHISIAEEISGKLNLRSNQFNSDLYSLTNVEASSIEQELTLQQSCVDSCLSNLDKDMERMKLDAQTYADKKRSLQTCIAATQEESDIASIEADTYDTLSQTYTAQVEQNISSIKSVIEEVENEAIKYGCAFKESSHSALLALKKVIRQ